MRRISEIQHGPQNWLGYVKDLKGELEKRSDLVFETYPLVYKCGTYDFVRIASKDIDLDDKVVLIRATLHGDEIAGAYTMLYHLNEVFDYAHKAGVKLIVWPCANPSGFERSLRYNGDGDRGDLVNNDFMRYELTDGQVLKDIGESNEFLKWGWSSDPRYGVRLCEETKLMHQLLKKDPLSQIRAVIDLHQDYFTPTETPRTYHYTNENKNDYLLIVEKIRKIVPIWGNVDIGAGFNDSMLSDENGFIVRHDGSLPDLFYRMGCKHGITPETTGNTPLDLACRVNLEWILGAIDLVAR